MSVPRSFQKQSREVQMHVQTLLASLTMSFNI